MTQPTEREIEQRARELRRQARRASVPDSANPTDAAEFAILNEREAGAAMMAAIRARPKN